MFPPVRTFLTLSVWIALIVLGGLAGLLLVVSIAVRTWGAMELRAASRRFEREVGPLSLETLARASVKDRARDGNRSAAGSSCS